MKKIFFLTLVFLIFANVAQAAPFLVCDPQAGVTHYQITGDPYWTGDIPAQADGSLRTDLATIPTGAHNISVRACNLWGCSSAVPFSFTKELPVAPANTRITP